MSVNIPSKSQIGNARPLFLIGCARSGTTLLAKVLNSHPAVLMTNETAVFFQLDIIIKKSRVGYAEGLPFGKEYHSLWADHLAEQAKTLIESYYEKIYKIEGKENLTYWGEKNPHHCECFPFISSLYPQALYIYLIRDPRDTACSLSEMLGVGYSESLVMWLDATIKCEAFVNDLDPTTVLCIRYEDFVANSEAKASDLFAWLGLDLSPEVERFLREYRNVNSHDLWLPEHTYTDFLTKSVGRWQRELSESDMSYTFEIAGDFMQRHQYQFEPVARKAHEV